MPACEHKLDRVLISNILARALYLDLVQTYLQILVPLDIDQG